MPSRSIFIAGKFELKKSRNDKYYFSLLAGNGQAIGQSRMYSSETARDGGIESCKTNGPGAAVVDLTS
ncbi:YegP family protein [Polaromonas jejuensis]|uniref:YegP family protein n=1 Tax=Polaromonas jejuensis TaxID=457502 RepID=A0ABW0Q7R6_9BURK